LHHRNIIIGLVCSMGKEKAKGSQGVANKHMHARVAFLHQAATYLATQSVHSNSNAENDGTRHVEYEPNHRGGPGREHLVGRPSSYLASQLKQVALKSQIRLHHTIKHTTCKVCDAILLDGKTCRRRIENASRGKKKPHADVLVIQCSSCNAEKRFPVGAQRQQSKKQRATRDVQSEKGEQMGQLKISPPASPSGIATPLDTHDGQTPL
jgi:ribonuclease P protein subunit RPR2